jgi:hypothetical protein
VARIEPQRACLVGFYWGVQIAAAHHRPV